MPMAHMARDETFHDSSDFQTFVWKREKCFAIARIGQKLLREEEETEKREARKGKDRIARICKIRKIATNLVKRVYFHVHRIRGTTRYKKKNSMVEKDCEDKQG